MKKEIIYCDLLDQLFLLWFDKEIGYFVENIDGIRKTDKYEIFEGFYEGEFTQIDWFVE